MRLAGSPFPYTWGVTKIFAQASAALCLSAVLTSGMANDQSSAVPEKAPETTKVSQMMRAIERRANEGQPAFPVVILDDDMINLQPANDGLDLRHRMYEVLKKRGIELRWHVRSEAFEAMGGLKGPDKRVAGAMRVRAEDYQDSRIPMDQGVQQKNVCLVIPQSSDLSSRSLVSRWIGHTGTYYMETKADPGPYAMQQRSLWHSVWSCLDTEYYVYEKSVKGLPALDIMHKVHKSKVFNDVAATLTMATEGNLDMAQYIADVRAISTSWGPRNTTKENYYDAAVFYTTRAQDLVVKHIRDVGEEAVSRYTLEDIKGIARSLTEAGALTKEEFRLLADRAGDRSVSLIAQIQNRAKEARARIQQSTSIPVRKSAVVEDHYDVKDFLRDLSDAERRAMEADIQTAVDQAKLKGWTPEQGIIRMIDTWRDELHGTSENRLDIERKLMVLSLMLGYGHLNMALGISRPLAPTAEVPVAPASPKSEPQQVPETDHKVALRLQ